MPTPITMTFARSGAHARQARTRAALMTGLLLCLAAPGAARAAITVYYLRHAEIGYNVKGDYLARKIPTNEWPAWVGNCKVFTPLGLAQVQACVTNLQTLKFDLIAVSPLWRARHTVLPYLKASGCTAELWPELTETHAVEPIQPAAAQPADSRCVTLLKPIVLPAEEARWLRVRRDAAGQRELCATNAAGARVLATRVATLMRARAGTQDFTVLLVGHGNAGVMLIRQLSGDAHGRLTWLRNGTLWMAREQTNGTFRLSMLNNQAYRPAPAARTKQR